MIEDNLILMKTVEGLSSERVSSSQCNTSISKKVQFKNREDEIIHLFIADAFEENCCLTEHESLKKLPY